jgi:hypothetical protein
VNNGINLAFLAQAPAIVDQSAPAAPQGNNASSGNQLFANLLMQKMSPGSGLSNDNSGRPLLGFSPDDLVGLLNSVSGPLAGLNGNANIASLLGSLKQQSGKNDPASLLKSLGNPDDNSANAADPMLATWLASLAALQQQPKTQDFKLPGNADAANLLAGIQNNLANSPVDPRALKALEHALSFLDKSLGLDGPSNGKAQINSDRTDAPAPTTSTGSSAPVKDVPPTQEPKTTVPVVKADDGVAQQALSAEISKIANQPANGTTKVDLPKPDSKTPSVAPVVPGTADRSQQVQPSMLPKGDTRSDNQGSANQALGNQSLANQGSANEGSANQSGLNQESQQSGDGHSSSDSRKGIQVDQLSSKFNVQSATVTVSGSPEQSVPTVPVQPMPHSSNVEANHGSPTPTPSAAEIREPAHLGAADALPPRTVNQSSLMQAASQAEMRVSVKTESAGTMDVRAMVEGNHISATVAAQHSATRDWMVANIHELNQSLSRDDLRLKTFEVTESSLRNDTNGSASGQQGQPDAQKPMQYFQSRKDALFTSSPVEELETETSGTAARAISLLA